MVTFCLFYSNPLRLQAVEVSIIWLAEDSSRHTGLIVGELLAELLVNDLARVQTSLKSLFGFGVS